MSVRQLAIKIHNEQMKKGQEKLLMYIYKYCEVVDTEQGKKYDSMLGCKNPLVTPQFMVAHPEILWKHKPNRNPYLTMKDIWETPELKWERCDYEYHSNMYRCRNGKIVTKRNPLQYGHFRRRIPWHYTIGETIGRDSYAQPSISVEQLLKGATKPININKLVILANPNVTPEIVDIIYNTLHYIDSKHHPSYRINTLILANMFDAHPDIVRDEIIKALLNTYFYSAISNLISEYLPIC